MGKSSIKRVSLGVIALFVYLYFSLAISKEAPLQFDVKLSGLVDGISIESWGLFTFLGETKGFILVAIIVLLWLAVRKKDGIATGVYFLGVGSGYVVNSLLKTWHQRPRPPVEQRLAEVDSLSFPSGNAMIGLILYALAACFIVKDIKSKTGKVIVTVTVSIIILLYGISRISLHVHYPSDIVAGYAFGIVWTMIMLSIYEAISKKKLAR